jgi:hypothetical protein
MEDVYRQFVDDSDVGSEMLQGGRVVSGTLVVSTTVSSVDRRYGCCPEDNLRVCEQARSWLQRQREPVAGLSVELVDPEGAVAAVGSATEPCRLMP